MLPVKEAFFVAQLQNSTAEHYLLSRFSSLSQVPQNGLVSLANLERTPETFLRQMRNKGV
jgi:hypothetical protein